MVYKKNQALGLIEDIVSKATDRLQMCFGYVHDATIAYIACGVYVSFDFLVILYIRFF
mgnify:CR=1 FL=1